MSGDDRTAKLHGIWLAVSTLVEVGIIAVFFANGAFRLLFAIGLIAYGFRPILIVGLLLGLVFLAACLAPFVGIFAYRWKLPTRIGLVLAPLVVAGAAHAVAVAIGIPGVVEEPPAPPPAYCSVSTADPTVRLRPCDPNAIDAGEPMQGDCPAGYTCREPIGQHGPPVCFIACYHDCVCPLPSTCVNAGCRFPGDPLP